MPKPRALSRRTLLKSAAGVGALPLVHIRTAGAAGSLTAAFASSFVPGADDAMRRLIEDWGKKNSVEVRADFLSFVNDQIIVTLGAEAQARAGHDVVALMDYDVVSCGDKLEPVDDLVDRLIAAHGPPLEGVAYLGKIAGTWHAVPTSIGSVFWCSESRIDMFAQHDGLDVRATFPVASQMGPGYDQWTWDAFLAAAEKCFTAGAPFGLPISNCGDANAWIDALFRGFGAQVVDAKGNVMVKSDAVREALDYLKRLAPFLPPEVYTWNDASNNRALIAGKSALIFNPPSAWAGAVKDNPAVGEQIWHHPLPAGQRGRFLPWEPKFLAVWSFARNKSAARDLIAWLSERAQVEASLNASHGYDAPVFTSLTEFPIWAEAGPPKGTLYNCTLPPAHRAVPAVVGAPAPPTIARQISVQRVLPKLAAQVTQGGIPIEAAMTEAERDLAGIIMR
jgi:hypothetical protein